MNDMSALLESLEKASILLAAFVPSIPADKLHLQRGEGFWTIAQHVDHLAQVQPMLQERIGRFLQEDHPVFIPYTPGDDDAHTLPPRPDVNAALESFGNSRQAQIDLLRQAQPSDWEKKADHPEYKQYTLYILARHILMHDHWHMYRMEELWLTKDEFLTSVP